MTQFCTGMGFSFEFFFLDPPRTRTSNPPTQYHVVFTLDCYLVLVCTKNAKNECRKVLGFNRQTDKDLGWNPRSGSCRAMLHDFVVCARDQRHFSVISQRPKRSDRHRLGQYPLLSRVKTTLISRVIREKTQRLEVIQGGIGIYQ